MMVLVPFWVLGASSIKISTDAPDGRVEVNETFHIYIDATDMSGGSLNVPSMPPGVKYLYKSERQTSKISNINGRHEEVNITSLILTCKGQTPGKYTFGPVTINGKKSNTVSYQVVPASSGKTGNRAPNRGANQGPAFDPNAGPLFIGNGNEEMYLRASVNKTTAYEQEAIEYTVKLYTTYGDIKFLGAAAAPKFEGFVVEVSPDVSTSFKFEDVNGKTFKTAVIARYIIFPQKAGKLKVSGNTYTVSTDARQYYHDPYYQTITVKQPVQLNVTPNDVTIEVNELPQPIPDNFIGGVGNFRISASMPSTRLATNEAASLIYTIEGEGNIKYLKLPELSNYFPKSIEIYSPEVNVDANVTEGTVKGTARYDYSIIPREEGQFTLPALRLSYFDPQSKQYKQIETSKFDVEVSLGKTSSMSQKAMTFNKNLLPVGATSNKIGSPMVDTWLFWLWYVIPVIIFALSLGVYRKYLRDHSDMASFRSKNANKAALKRLSKAYACIKSNQEEQFYDEMLAALWGYLADKLKIPTSKLNRSNVGEEFKKHGVKESTFMPILSLIDECEYAKYTPVSRNSNMQQIYRQAVESLSEVESEYDKENHITAPEEEQVVEPTTDNYVNSTELADRHQDEEGKTDSQES